MSKEPKLHILQDEALGIAIKYGKIFKAAKAEQEELHKEFEERNKQIYEKRMAELRELWIRMAALTGLDPELSWNNPAFFFETKYLDYGFAAIEEREPPKDPFGAMFGIEEPQEEEVQEDNPDPSKLN